ncbi:MAG: hypothetical protein QM771_17390 [Nitrospira sp.]
MADQKDDKPKLPLTAVMALLLAAVSSLIIYQVPLKTSRPIDKEAEKSASVRDRVQSRLWQDPFEAVASHIQKEKSTQDGKHGHHASPGLLEDASTTKGAFRFHLMPVFVDGSPYASGVESRLRDRYALVSALGAAGYLPESGESIRYFEWKQTERPVSIVPVEWFVPGPRLSTTNHQGQSEAQPMLVLWLKEQDLGAKPLQALTDLVSYLKREMKSSPSAYRVLGPRSSGSLNAMLEELKSDFMAGNRVPGFPAAPQPAVLSVLKGAEFYSSWATAADPILLGETSSQQTAKPVEDRFKTAGLTLIRTIGTDDALVRELVLELTRRNIDLTASSKIPHIALISEWDTLYGRALPQTFVAVTNSMAEHKHKKPEDRHPLKYHLDALRNEQYPPWVHRYSYLAGLDGELPPKSDEKESPGSQAKGKIADGALRGAQSAAEAPAGRSQLDYLRRLVETLKYEEATKGGEFKAIGVLGSDVYDKLMILQALRSNFPHALFFTTDLDARLTHPSQSQWTRNLIVASHFGLELHPKLQSPIPPFRDSYQTALFYSALRAVNYFMPLADENKLETPFKVSFPDDVKPRLYEVGRHGAVDVSPDVEYTQPPMEQRLASLHLLRPDLDPETGKIRLAAPETLALIGATVVVILCLVLLLNGELWHALLRLKLRDVAWTVLPVVAIAGGFLWWAMRDGTGGEPISLTDGISVWPTTTLRLLAFVLTLAFFYHSWRRLRANDAELMQRFGLTPAGASTAPVAVPIVGIHYWRPAATGSVDATNLWQEYQALGRWKQRLMRVMLQTFLYGLFGVLLMRLYGWPVTPCRGNACFYINGGVLGISVFAMTLLMFYVLDATRLCRRLITIMIGTTIRWPDGVLEQEAAKLGVDKAYVREWIAIEFIAQRTAVISAMIYYPFVIVFLMGIARHSYFDRWDFPIGLLLIFGLNTAYAFGNGLFLRRTAEQAKRAAMEQLKGRLRTAPQTLPLTNEKSQQIERMLTKIEQTRDGAFLPFTQHPLFGAIALPTGGTGLVFLLDYLATLF